MGFSVGCTFNYATGDWGVYFKEDIGYLSELLNQADLVVGFNIVGFDLPLIRSQGGNLWPDSDLGIYDLLEESRKAMGWTPAQRFPKGMRLDDHLEATFGAGFMKTEECIGSQNVARRPAWPSRDLLPCRRAQGKDAF